MNSTRFVTIYGFVQSNIQHVSPASETPTGALPLDPAEGCPFFGPRWGMSAPRFLATYAPLYGGEVQVL